MLRVFDVFKRRRSEAPSEPLTNRFTNVYRNNVWGDEESVSGPGSRKESGSVHFAKMALEKAYSELRIRTISDIPCGDFNWMPAFLAGHQRLKYRGFDIVEEIIVKNRGSYPQARFDVLDVTSEVPPCSDLVFCKDLVNHLAYVDVLKVIRNIKRSRSKYLLLSNNFGHTNVELKEDNPGGSRFLDILAEPFDFPKPLWNVNYFGLWRMSDISLKSIDHLALKLSTR
jgi:hypothetical protein